MKRRSVAYKSSSTTWPKGMRDVIRWKHAALLALAVLAAGCSSNSKKELPPAELTSFKEEVVLQKQWSRSIGDGQGETYNMLVPAIDGDNIVAADVTGVVISMDRMNGDVKWKKDLELPVSGAVGVGYGLVMVGTLKGEVVALDSSTGEEKWRARVTSEVLAPPATNGDIVVVQTQDDRVIGLDAATGNQRWLYDSTPAVLTLRGTSGPVVTNNLAVAGLSTGKVVALDTQNGVPAWETRVAIPQGRSELDRVVDIDGGLLLSGETLYVATYQGRVAALDLQSGRVNWQRDASSYAGVAQGFGSVYVSLASGTVESVDERSTTALWSNDSLARRQLSAPEVFSSYVAVGDFEGYLHLLSQVDGRFVGRERIDSEGLHGFDRALLGQQHMAGFIGQPVAARLQIDQIALFQVHDLIGHPGNGHGVAGQEKFIFIAPHAQHQGRASTRPHHAVRLVLVQHGNGVGPAQFGAGGFDGLEQVAVVQAIDQVADDFGVRLAGKHIALGLPLADVPHFADGGGWF